VYAYLRGNITLLIKIPNYFVNSNSLALFNRNTFVAWTNLGDISIFQTTVTDKLSSNIHINNNYIDNLFIAEYSNP